MKCVKILLIASMVLIGIYSCSEHDVRADSVTITGKWRLVGTQISPGFPVPISPVDPFPLQTLEFKHDSSVVSTVIGITPIVSYSIHDDTLFHSKSLFLYAGLGLSKPVVKGVYNFRLGEDTLRLGNIGCYEVCDLIFKRM